MLLVMEENACWGISTVKRGYDALRRRVAAERYMVLLVMEENACWGISTVIDPVPLAALGEAKRQRSRRETPLVCRSAEGSK